MIFDEFHTVTDVSIAKKTSSPLTLNLILLPHLTDVLLYSATE